MALACPSRIVDNARVVTKRITFLLLPGMALSKDASKTTAVNARQLPAAAEISGANFTTADLKTVQSPSAKLSVSAGISSWTSDGADGAVNSIADTGTVRSIARISSISNRFICPPTSAAADPSDCSSAEWIATTPQLRPISATSCQEQHCPHRNRSAPPFPPQDRSLLP